ncbi:MAG: hypothetical protein ACQETL_10845 [Bacteroidota bacterium]
MITPFPPCFAWWNEKFDHSQYELSIHLGNVLAVITDNVNMVNSTENSEWYESKAWPTSICIK